MQLSLLASTPDIATTGYMVNLLLGPPAELASEAKALGYDGIEFLPGPPGTVSIAEMGESLREWDVSLVAINSGRIVAEGLTLLHPERAIRQRALDRLKDLLDFAGEFGVPVTLAGVKGSLPPGASIEGVAPRAEEVFGDLARFAAARGSLLLLAPTDDADSNFICTVDEALAWVQRVSHPGFGLMLDMHQLIRKESSVAEALHRVGDHLRHVHLYDLGRIPPGIRKDSSLDWPGIVTALQDIAYQGSLSVSLARAGDRRAQAQQTANFLRSLMDDATR